MYDRFIRETFGQKKIAEVKYSDVYQFYQYLLEKEDIQINTLETIHTLLHPTFQLAVRDEIIRANPSDGIMAEIRQQDGSAACPHNWAATGIMDFVANHPTFCHWWAMFAVLLGTGCRIGEALGLRWEDLDFDSTIALLGFRFRYVQDWRTIISHRIIHDTVIYAYHGTIPMLDTVRDAFEMIAEEQEETGRNETVIDGMTGFVFKNRFGNVPNPQSVNRAIKRIIAEYNSIEEVQAKKEKREPIMLPNFSAHHLRHTFCTRLCENESNLKIIQSVMGHRDIQTTMNIYAEATEDKKRESFERLSAKMDVF